MQSPDNHSHDTGVLMMIERLPYAPPICADETLWSWVTRIAQYHGWTADEFLRLLGQGEAPWEGYFRQVDVDCAAPAGLLNSLAQITGYDRGELLSHQVSSSPSTLWLDDRVAFCESCWVQADAVPYVRRAWLDAWCIECPIHECTLVTIAKVHRPRRGADWNAAWTSRLDWAQRTKALWTPTTSELLGRGSVVILRPPRVAANVLSDLSPEGAGDKHHGIAKRPTVGRSGMIALGPDEGTPDFRHSRPAVTSQVATPPSLGDVEKRLVLLAGRSWGDFSLVRVFFDLHERVAWRNAAEGYEATRPVCEPVGSLTIRSGAIRIGRALTDVLFDRPYREPRIANPLRRWLGSLYGRPRVHLLRELGTWPAAVRERWKRQFEWGDELEWLRYAPPNSTTSRGPLP